MTPICVSHRNCPDGAAAAWVVDRFFMGEIEHFGASYNEPPPDVDGREVVIVDFSYPLDVTLRMAEQAESVTILDHHQSAVEALDGKLPSVNIKYDFDIERSGARIAWDWFYPDERPPDLLLHVEDRDLWRFAIPGTAEVMAAVTSYALDVPTMHTLMPAPIGRLFDEGRAVLRFREQLIVAAVEGATERVIAGHRVLAANCPYTVGSDVAGRLAEGRPLGAYWLESHGVEHWGLRSRDGGEDVARIAEQFDGGGHRNASGMRAAPGAFRT